MSKFKVGDRVRVLRSGAMCALVDAGDEGVVRDTYAGSEGVGHYAVQMDNARPGHSGLYGFDDSVLEAVAPTAPAADKLLAWVKAYLTDHTGASWASERYLLTTMLYDVYGMVTETVPATVNFIPIPADKE